MPLRPPARILSVLLLAACSRTGTDKVDTVHSDDSDVADTDATGPDTAVDPQDSDQITACLPLEGRIDLLSLGWTWKGRGDVAVRELWPTGGALHIVSAFQSSSFTLHEGQPPGTKLRDVTPDARLSVDAPSIQPRVLPGLLPGEAAGLWMNSGQSGLPDGALVLAGTTDVPTGDRTLAQADRWLVFNPEDQPDLSNLVVDDLTGDGVPDLVDLKGGSARPERVFVRLWPGPFPQGTTTEPPAPTRIARIDGDTFGVLDIADVNDDGFGDVIVAAETSLRTSTVRIFHGPLSTAPPRLDADVIIHASEAHPPFDGTTFGNALAHGDFDGDGVIDLAIGNPSAEVAGQGTGAVYVFRGPLPTGPVNADDAWAVLLGSRANVRFGLALDVHDLNGDGRDDLLVREHPARRMRDATWLCDTGASYDSSAWVNGDSGPDALPPEPGCTPIRPASLAQVVFADLSAGTATAHDGTARLLGASHVTPYGNPHQGNATRWAFQGSRQRVFTLDLCRAE